MTYSAPNHEPALQVLICASVLVLDVAGAVRRVAARGAVQRPVVHDDEHAVAGDLQVLLDVVRAELDRAVVRGERVLRAGARRAAVGDDERRRSGLRARLGLGGRGEETTDATTDADVATLFRKRMILLIVRCADGSLIHQETIPVTDRERCVTGR